MSNLGYGMYKKLVVQFAVVEHADMLTMSALPQFKYAGSRIEDNNSLKYYKNGFTLIKTSSFLDIYSRATQLRPSTDYVLLLSVNKGVVPNKRTILKTRNRVMIAFPIDIRMVREGDRVQTSVGLSLNPDNLDYTSVSVNMYTGVGELVAKTVEMREYKEIPEDFVGELSTQLDPIFERIGSTVRNSAVDVWNDIEGSKKMLDFIERALAKTGLYSSFATGFRKRLGEALIAGGGSRAVSVDDVSWDTPEEMKYMVDQAGGNVEVAKGMRRNEIRLKWLLDDCTFDRRLVELTRDEIDNKVDLTRPNITCAMTDDEIGTWYDLTDVESLAELELMVLNRWRVANG